MKIGSRTVGPGAPVFVIAEIGSNHGGSLVRALALIDTAADAGADAAKFQYFRVDRFLVPRPDPASLRKYELPDEWLPKLVARCQSRGIEFLCTAFDLDSLDVIDPFVDAHKVGSWEAANDDYLDAVSAKGKPMIVSNGRGTSYRPGFDTGVILACVSKYPAPIDGYLRRKPLFDWGVSDHTLHPTIVPAAATALGACVVEKHFRHWHSLEDEGEKKPEWGYQPQTPDSAVSINPTDFRELVEAVRLTEKAVRG